LEKWGILADLQKDDANASESNRMRGLRVVLGTAGFLPIVLLVGLAVTQGFDVAAFGVLAPEIRHTFHLDNAGIDAVTSLTAAVPVMCSIFLGYFGDRGSRIHLAAGGAFLWGVAAIFTGLAPVLAVLIAARLVGGVGLLASQTIYPSLLSDFYPPEGLAQIFTVYLIGSTGLGLIGSPLAGWLGSTVGWRPTFVVLAAPTFLCATVLLRVLNEPPRRSAQPAVTDEGAVGAAGGLAGATAGGPSIPGVPASARFEGSIVEGFRGVRAIRSLRRGWISAFLFGAGIIPLATLVSDFFHDVYHIGPTSRGSIAAFVGLFGLTGIILGGVIAQRLMTSNRLDRFPILSGVAVMEFGVFTLVMANAPDLWGSVAAACVLAVGAVGFLPAYITFVAVISPAHLRSQAYSWSLFFYALGAICISPIVGTIADAYGQRIAMTCLAGLVTIGGLVGLSVRKFVKGDLERLETAG
jgi:MFS family permease